jgi:cytochrome c oxidase assembly protein subunit 15
MKYSKYVKTWLIVGCVLLFFQIVIGGITRITGSGLSITKWEIITGTIPPLNERDWNIAFDLYKTTPQYEKVNAGMDLSKFKFIYFWEYLHRLWARLMGIIFLVPFCIFLFTRQIDKKLIIQLLYVIFWAALAAVFGWIMVASGLIDRPWVNAYKLSIHLGIALTTLCFLLWACFSVFDSLRLQIDNIKFRRWVKLFFIFICIQIFFGAIVSGMRAALYYPSWPDIGGQFIPSILLDSSEWHLNNIVEYDKNTFMPALIHVLHRYWGYFVYGFGMFIGFKILRYPLPRQAYLSIIAIIVLLNVQVLLGILTLINSEGSVPVSLGVMHQAVAIFILALALYEVFFFRRRDNTLQRND